MSMFDKLDSVVKRFETLTERLADPSLYDRASEMREINTERSNIEPIVHKYKEYKKVVADIEGNKDIIHNEKDEEIREMAKEELAELESKLPGIEHELKLLLLPKDPNDEKNVLLEIRPGPVEMRLQFLLEMFGECIETISTPVDGNQMWFLFQKVIGELKKLLSAFLEIKFIQDLNMNQEFTGFREFLIQRHKGEFIPLQSLWPLCQRQMKLEMLNLI
jgi:PCRF domain